MVGVVAYPEDSGAAGRESSDAQRVVALTDDFVILPDSTVDDTDAGWGERYAGNDDRLLADKPPHWQ